MNDPISDFTLQTTNNFPAPVSSFFGGGDFLLLVFLRHLA
jgi:hypothetical protein